MALEPPPPSPSVMAVPERPPGRASCVPAGPTAAAAELGLRLFENGTVMHKSQCGHHGQV
jgi:hypothetical protein